MNTKSIYIIYYYDLDQPYDVETVLNTLESAEKYIEKYRIENPDSTLEFYIEPWEVYTDHEVAYDENYAENDYDPYEVRSECGCCKCCGCDCWMDEEKEETE